MSVSQLKDGRWVCQYTKGKNKENPNSNKKYFGRGQKAKNKALSYNASLGFAAFPRIVAAEKKQREMEKQIALLVKGDEKEIKEELSFLLDLKSGENGTVKTEIYTPSGYVDILTEDEIIEVKNARDWKNAIGQLLAYNNFFPDKKLRMHLFEKNHLKKYKKLQDCTLNNLCKVTKSHNIMVSFHSREIYRRMKIHHQNVVPLF